MRNVDQFTTSPVSWTRSVQNVSENGSSMPQSSMWNPTLNSMHHGSITPRSWKTKRWLHLAAKQSCTWDWATWLVRQSETLYFLGLSVCLSVCHEWKCLSYCCLATNTWCIFARSRMNASKTKATAQSDLKWNIWGNHLLTLRKNWHTLPLQIRLLVHAYRVY